MLSPSSVSDGIDEDDYILSQALDFESLVLQRRQEKTAESLKAEELVLGDFNKLIIGDDELLSSATSIDSETLAQLLGDDDVKVDAPPLRYFNSSSLGIPRPTSPPRCYFDIDDDAFQSPVKSNTPRDQVTPKKSRKRYRQRRQLSPDLKVSTLEEGETNEFAYTFRRRRNPSKQPPESWVVKRAFPRLKKVSGKLGCRRTAGGRFQLEGWAVSIFDTFETDITRDHECQTVDIDASGEVFLIQTFIPNV